VFEKVAVFFFTCFECLLSPLSQCLLDLPATADFTLQIPDLLL
jgi:hypothetical protein